MGNKMKGGHEKGKGCGAMEGKDRKERKREKGKSFFIMCITSRL